MSSTTVKQLKDALRAKGAKVSGTKAILSERLQVWDENLLDRTLVKCDLVKSESDFVFPQIDLFSTILGLNKKEVRYFTLDKVNLWFEVRSAQASQAKGRLLFLKKFLKQVMSCAKDGYIFLTALCAAQMKKHVDYTCRIVVKQAGISCRITQASCTCAAGQGFSAACKHLAALAYNLEHYAITGESMENVPPTSKLQLWHKPTGGSGIEPVSVSEMLKQTNKTLLPTIKHKISAHQLANLFIANGISSPIISNRSANMTAMLNDHDYIPNLAFEIMKRRLYLSDHGIKKVEKQTRKQSSCKIWREKRRCLITASIAYHAARTVKAGNLCAGIAKRQMSTRNLNHVPAIQWGRANETEALKQYQLLTNQEVKPSGLVIHPILHYLAASPDGVSCDGQVIFEVKCPYKNREDVPEKATFLFRHNNVCSLKRNHQHYVQCQMQMHITGCRRCEFIVWTPKGIYLESIKYNRTCCEKIVVRLQEYYEKVFSPLCVTDINL